MTEKDGGLRRIFRERFPLWHWTAIETGCVSPGAPDVEFCAPGGVSGWVEFKRVNGFKITFEPLQPGWIFKRARLGGRVFVAVRRKVDELHIIPGTEIVALTETGLKGRQPLTAGGLRSWDWKKVEQTLLGDYPCFSGEKPVK